MADGTTTCAVLDLHGFERQLSALATSLEHNGAQYVVARRPKACNWVPSSLCVEAMCAALLPCAAAVVALCHVRERLWVLVAARERGSEGGKGGARSALQAEHTSLAAEDTVHERVDPAKRRQAVRCA